MRPAKGSPRRRVQASPIKRKINKSALSDSGDRNLRKEGRKSTNSKKRVAERADAPLSPVVENLVELTDLAEAEII